ncbi:hypothetical protein CTEN210_18405 [Chaetoceros tenuissimus]|uniref:Helicase-associated domain-containing protein n=1 Tax=Chaetoceros tenuissimus TaxID=426638 RepID=A0AAD3DCH3_9STRA|nr:hypothetical protein CTEN210_18405 [Chaetoceros tenuissimus]
MQPDNNLIWLNRLQELLEHKKRYGHCDVQATYDNQTLFQWVKQQRDDYAKLNMSEENIKMLNAIGFDWKVSREKMWLDNFEQLKGYKERYGDCNVSVRYKENQPLGKWVYTQRSQYKQSKLSDERIKILNSIGFRWTAPYDKIWENQLEALKVYKSKRGHFNVPGKYKENQSLATWVEYQRSQFKLSKLSEERVNMLNAIGFDWTAPTRDSAWSYNFDQLKLYKSTHGDCNVPARYKENRPLGTWVYTQRSRYKLSKLSDERIARLNSIGFDWTIKVSKENTWSDKFEQLEQYKSKYGDCNVLYDDENKPLANWVYKQRSQYKHFKLSNEKIARLNSIGFNWTVSDKWQDKIEALKKYTFKHGDCKLPAKHDGNQSLPNQNMLKGHFTLLTKERMELLDSTGFVSSMRQPKINVTSEKNRIEHAIGNDIDTDQEESETEQNNEQIVTYDHVAPIRTETGAKTIELEHTVGNKIDSEQQDDHKHIAIETSSRDLKEKNTTKEKGETSCKRSLQDRIQVLCKLSIMFQQEKDAIYADMKRRKLGNSV